MTWTDGLVSEFSKQTAVRMRISFKCRHYFTQLKEKETASCRCGDESTPPERPQQLKQCYMLVKAWRQIRRDASYSTQPYHTVWECVLLLYEWAVLALKHALMCYVSYDPRGAGGGSAASGHAGDKQPDVRELLPIWNHLLWPRQIERYSSVG